MTTTTELERPYVLVTHRPSGRCFVLDRHYRLLSYDRPAAEVRWIAAVEFQLTVKNDETWEGWFPTLARQIPDWAAFHPHTEFTAEWLVCPQCFENTCRCLNKTR